MNFTYVIDTPFCEGRLLGIPEYLNSFSSLFITYVGYKELIKKKHMLIDIQKIYIMFILCGLVSFMFHYTMFFGWKMFDEISMIITLWHGIYILKKINYNNNKYLLLKHTIPLHTFNFIFIVFNFFKFFENYFPLFFTIEILTLFYDYIILMYKYGDYNYNGITGITIMIISGIIWGITEKYCNYYLIFGHLIWHIGIAYGLNIFIKYVTKSIQDDRRLNYLNIV